VSDKFTTIKTGSCEKKESDSGVYIKQYQLIKNTESGTTSLGLVFENISEKDISSAEIEAVFICSDNSEIKKDFTAAILGAKPGAQCPMKELFDAGNGDITDVRLSVKSVNYGKLNEKPSPAVLTPQKGGKKHSRKGKKRTLIAVLTIAAVICAAAGIYLIVSPSDDSGHGIGKVTGKGDPSLAQTTENAEQTASEEESKLAAAGGHSVSSAGQQLSDDKMPAELKSFISGKFYLSGTIYSASSSETDKLTLAVNGADHFMTEDKNGVVIGVCSSSGTNYYVNMKKSTYLEVTSALLEQLGMTQDDFKLKIFDMSLVKSHKLYSSTVDSKDGLCLEVTYADGFTDRVYYADGRVVQINAYDAQSKLLESIICSEFTGTIPDNMNGVSSYSKVDSYEEFFNSLAD